MSDDNAGAATATPIPTSTSRHVAGASSSPPGPGPSGLRRSATLDMNLRRRSTFNSPFDAAGPRDRRSSTFSDYSLGDEARDLFNPKPPGARVVRTEEDTDSGTGWASVPLALALLPALGGILFQNGSAFVTDVMLLGLAAIFLHWSVTQPWNWYYSAQSIRVREELRPYAAMDMDDDSDTEQHPPGANGSTNAGAGTAEEGFPATTSASSPPSPQKPVTSSPDRPPANKLHALAELYIHEVLALASCFLFPVLGSYLLHAIRAQLSRPSEGLVSNYNLTIFLLASELRPLSHLMKLVQSRTLHLQRLVHENPFVATHDAAAMSTQVGVLTERLDALEARCPAEVASGTDRPNDSPDAPSPPPPSFATKGCSGPSGSSSGKPHSEATLVRDVRNAIQPELDALNRAVRRYEKKATVLSLHTESRFGALDTRLDDAIALATAAAKNSAPRPGLIQRLARSCAELALMPLRGLVMLLTLPFRSALGLVTGGSGKGSRGGKKRGADNGDGSNNRASRSMRGARPAGERAAARVPRR